jgi:transcriptional regulator with XRE-family HTH domain
MSAIAVNAIPCRSYSADVKKTTSPAPNFPQYLVALRKGKKLTQQQLADLAHISVVQLRRYEGGSSQPTLDVIRNLALALGVTTDQLAFGKDERGPDDDLRLQFEAVSRFEPEAKKVVQQVLDSMILQQEARRWSTGRR